MTDYSNPQIMKGVVNEAKQAGIFNIGKNKMLISDSYILKLNSEDASTLDMFLNNKSYGYKLIQIDFQLGMSSLVKQKKLIIKMLKETLFNYIYKIEIQQVKDESSRAWDAVSGRPLMFYFQSKDGLINIIKPRYAFQENNEGKSK